MFFDQFFSNSFGYIFIIFNIYNLKKNLEIFKTISIYLFLYKGSFVINCTLSHLKSFSVGDSSRSEWYFDIRQKVRDPAWVDVTFYNSVWRIYGWGNPRREGKGLYFKRDGFDRKSNRACNEWWWVGKVLLQGEMENINYWVLRKVTF